MQDLGKLQSKSIEICLHVLHTFEDLGGMCSLLCYICCIIDDVIFKISKININIHFKPSKP